MRRTPHRPRGESERLITLGELLKLEEIGQFPDDPVKIEDTQIRCVDVDVQTVSDIKTIT